MGNEVMIHQCSPLSVDFSEDQFNHTNSYCKYTMSYFLLGQQIVTWQGEYQASWTPKLLSQRHKTLPGSEFI